ncbi:MAG: glucose dehydrogenase, partial [Acidobacteria bacterium]
MNGDCRTRVMRLLAAILLCSSAALAQNVSLRLIASGLSSPVAIAHANDSRLFIVLQQGQIVIYDGTRVLPAPFLDIHTIVLCCGERGLLGLAFHPQYAQNGFFFVYYNDANGDINIARYHVTADSNVADPNSALILKTISHRDFSNHNGGQLAFGADGYLYAGTGDGGSGGDPSNNAQNLQVLLGKILRLDVDHGAPYIPPLNPFVGRTDASHEIWAYGV